YLVLLITAKLQSPATLAFLSEGRKHIGTFAQLAQLFALHFTPARIDPDFPPVIACDFHRSFGLDRLLVRIQSLNVDRDFIFRAVQVLFRTWIDVITLSRHTHVVAGNDLSTR